MRDVAIVGASAAPAEKRAPSVRELALQASALADAGLERVDGIVLGSMASVNQVRDARTALVQNMGGTGSTTTVHILEATA
jgi:5,10-methylene-tetrahydrofolate dehydrogenase/methenyl tetrahydrofolate cyclohydrolase